MEPNSLAEDGAPDLLIDTSGTRDMSKIKESTSGGGYFDLDNARDEGSEGRSPTTPLSIRLPPGPSVTETAFTALQYLPVPLLVLSSEKTIVLANEAMGRLLGIDSHVENGQRRRTEEVATATDILYGIPMKVLGMDLLQNATPVWVSWEDFLQSLKDDALTAFEAERSDGGDVTPTAVNYAGSAPPKSVPLTRANLARTTVHDVAVDVIFSTKRHAQTGLPNLNSVDDDHSPLLKDIGSHIQSTVIISVWTVDDAQHYTLTFTSAADVSSTASRKSQRTVARTQGLRNLYRTVLSHY